MNHEQDDYECFCPIKYSKCYNKPCAKEDCKDYREFVEEVKQRSAHHEVIGKGISQGV
jgi:hypothetical protein